jgi:hypothetical protein
METLDRLREEIDAHLFADALKQLQQRTWLMHWANFVFWSIADGPSKLLDLFLQDRFTVALQINAPHLLRCAPINRGVLQCVFYYVLFASDMICLCCDLLCSKRPHWLMNSSGCIDRAVCFGSIQFTLWAGERNKTDRVAHSNIPAYWLAPHDSSLAALALVCTSVCMCRYVVAAHLVSKGRPETQPGKWQSQLEQLKRMVVAEEYQYSDPVTDFVKAVYCDYDFERAQACTSLDTSK